MRFNMHLKDGPFDAIKAGSKDIEMPLMKRLRSSVRNLACRLTERRKRNEHEPDWFCRPLFQNESAAVQLRLAEG